MYTIKTPEYEKLLPSCYLAKQPLFIQGGPGIGKSAIPRQVFKQIADDEGREFHEWSELSLEQKKEALATPDKYWIFADMRTSQMDTMSLVGIPNLANKEMLENIPYSWVVYFTQKEARGCIFFDEINLAAPIVQSITYSAIHDRVISDRRISDFVYIFAAGNRMQDKGNTFEMPLPLRDRFAECEVELDSNAWLEWAGMSGVNPHLISFIKWKPDNLYNVDKVKAEKPATPRGVERSSNLLSDLDIFSDQAHMMVSISCGESFASEFQAYSRIYEALDWDRYYKDAAAVKTLKLDQQYAICAGLVQKFKEYMDDTKMLKKTFDISENLREDFAIFCYKMLSGITKGNLKKIVTKAGRQQDFIKYSKFLLDNIEEANVTINS